MVVNKDKLKTHKHPLCTCVHFCDALWTFLRVELMFLLFVLNDSKIPKFQFGHSEFNTI